MVWRREIETKQPKHQCDQWGRCHDVKNLFIIGGGHHAPRVFPLSVELPRRGVVAILQDPVERDAIALCLMPTLMSHSWMIGSPESALLPRAIIGVNWRQPRVATLIGSP